MSVTLAYFFLLIPFVCLRCFCFFTERSRCIVNRVRFIHVVSSIGFIKTPFYRVSYLNMISPFTFCYDVEPQLCVVLIKFLVTV